MKRTLAVLTALLTGLSMSGCGILRAIMTVNQNLPAVTETVDEPVVCVLSRPEERAVDRVRLRGSYDAGTRIDNIYGINVLHDGVVGRVGCPVEVVSDDLGGSDLIMEYNASSLGGVPEGNLIVLHYNEESGSYDTIPSELDTAAHTVTAALPEPGVYMLADAYAWYSAWGEDVSAYQRHSTVYTDTEFAFSIELPEEVQPRYVGDYLHEDSEGRFRSLLESEEDSEMTFGIEYLERPYCKSASDYLDNTAAAVGEYAQITDTGTFKHMPGTIGHYLLADYAGEYRFLYAFFPYNANQYIRVWFRADDEETLQRAMQSLDSFRFSGTPELPEMEQETFAPSYSVSLTALDISIELPYNLESFPNQNDWSNEYENGELVRSFTPLLRFDAAPRPDSFQAGFAQLEESSLDAEGAAEALQEKLLQFDDPLYELDSFDIGGHLQGYRFAVRGKGNITVCGFFEVPNTRQYVMMQFWLDRDAPDEMLRACFDALKTVSTAKPYMAVTPEMLHLDFPDNFFAEPSGSRRWAREYDNDGATFYRLWLYDTDHQKCSEAGNSDYYGAFFYLMQTGRSAHEEEERVRDQMLDAHNAYLADETEITLSNGQKGYVFAVRESGADAFSAYLYGFYETEDSDQFVQVEFMMNEPLSDDAYQRYWDCLCTADIDKKAR